MATLTEMTAEKLLDLGYAVATLGKPIFFFIPTPDNLENAFDLVAAHPREPGVLGVLVTDDSNRIARLAEAFDLPALRSWLTSGGKMELWAWSLAPGPSQKHRVWRVRRFPVGAKDLPAIPGKYEDPWA